MKILKRKTLAALLALSLLASLLPLGAQPAQAAAPSGQVIYVGNHAVTSGGYWKTDSDGNVSPYTEGGTPSDSYIHYDADKNILTLHNATIKKGLDYSESIQGGTYINGSAIGVFNQNGVAALTIQLEGTNTIAEVSKGIYVLATTGSSNLTIMGDGSLDANGSQNGIRVVSHGGDATLSIKNAKVTATASSSGDGVCVQSKKDSSVSLTVDGGSLTATGSGNNGTGIYFSLGTSTSDSGTPRLTVSNNAIVRANSGISDNSSADIKIGADSSGSTGGIVFDGGEGTVYGDVTLQENITINEGESLTIGDGASLTANGKLTVDGGTLNGTPSGDVTYKVTKVELSTSTLALTEGGSETLTAIITPDNATNQTVIWSSEPNNIVSITPDENDSKKAIITATGTGTTTIKATVDGKTAECSVTVNQATTTPVTSVTLDKSTLSLIEGENEQLTATVEPSNATNKAVTWSSSDSSIVTVGADQTDNTKATVKALKEGSATITATTADGNKTATCTVTVKEPPYTGKYSYEVSTSVGDHGSLSVDRYATEGDEVTITVTSDEAYKLDDLSVTAGGKEVALTAGGDGTFSFTMPSADVKITATFAKDPDWTEPEEPATDVSDIFLDIAANAWYKDAVQYAYAGGLMTGVSANEFAPEATTTRAMIVSMLARLEGVESAESAGFADVAADDWYATAVNWAAASGITSGTGDGNFSPNTAITREQLAAILMNYAQYKGQDVSARATLDTYNDATAISSWANDVMSWAVAEGLISGVTSDELQPQGNATRAQVAAILERFLAE